MKVNNLITRSSLININKIHDTHFFALTVVFLLRNVLGKVAFSNRRNSPGGLLKDRFFKITVSFSV